MTIITLLLVLVAATPSGDAPDVTMLDFSAEWCGPCRQMRPAVEQLTRAGLPIKAIDIDGAPELAQRYSVQSVPTFIVVDAAGKELARTAGAQPAAELEKFFRAAQAKARKSDPSPAVRRPAPDSGPRDGDRGDSDSDPDSDPDSEPDAGGDWADAGEAPEARRFQNPKAWETVVRIRILGQGSVGFGSGTIISSTPEESLILTCAHVFKIDNQRRQPQPSSFPRKIMVDLFDGNLRGTKPAHVSFAETVEGKAVDYDFTLDVGLIRIRPGRRLPSARVVPAHWSPKERMHMLTVGCSEGHDASVWATKILKPKTKGLTGNPHYEAIECAIAPIQGRSGGGLFTDDGYVAGVCNFAEPRGNIGLYATPTSIYRMLDRNSLMALYAPVNSGGRLIADAGPDSGRPTRAAADRVGTGRRGWNREDGGRAIARGQSPERDDERLAAADQESDDEFVMIPSPEMLKIKVPAERKGRVSRSAPVAVSQASADGARWRLRSAPAAADRPKTEQTAARLDGSLAVDPFQDFTEEADAETGSERTTVRKPAAAAPGDQLDWRPVK